MNTKNNLTSEQAAELVGGELVGAGDLPITGIQGMKQAEETDITLIGDKQYAQRWGECKAKVALVKRGIEVDAGAGEALIVVKSIELASVKLLEHFAGQRIKPEPGVDASALVDVSAELGEGVRIGAGCVVGPGVKIGAGTVLHPNVTLMGNNEIGVGCVLYPGVVMYDDCHVGDRCILHGNVNIGADGFGYRASDETSSYIKIPHIGSVEIGNDVEIGAGSCVDRGKFSATRIGDGTKIDNLVQIAHNCQIGRCVIIAGHTVVGGSVEIGDWVTVAGNVALKEQLTIGDGAVVLGGSCLLSDVGVQETVGGYPGRDGRTWLRECAALKKLPGLIQDVRLLRKKLEKQQ